MKERAILTVFSTASAPVLKKIAFLAKSPGAACQPQVGLVYSYLCRCVDQEVDLAVGSGQDLGVAVTDVEHPDATHEIDVADPVLIPDLGSAGAGRHEVEGWLQPPG